MQFAEMVREARQQARLSQRGLAEQLTTAQKPEGVWATYVGQIEKGDKVPSDEVCIKLAEVLKLDPDVVLLAAYQAKANSQEGRDLFAKMARSLTDPVVSELLASDEPLAPSVLEALADADTRDLLGDQTWLGAVARARKVQRERDVLGLLTLVESMDDKQWGVIMGMIETMGLKASGR